MRYWAVVDKKGIIVKYDGEALVFTTKKMAKLSLYRESESVVEVEFTKKEEK